MSKQQGFTLIEMMVSLLLGVFIAWLMIDLVAGSSKSINTLRGHSELHENGHFLSSTLSKEIRYAGYFGQFSPTEAPISSDVEVCSKGSNVGLDHPIVGKYASTGTDSCYQDKLTGTDVLAVRRADFDLTATPIDTTKYYLQSRFIDPSLDISELNYVLDVGGSSAFTVTNWINNSGADIRQFHRKIYYVRDDNVFVEKEIIADPSGQPAWSDAKPMANGVENFQVRYGFDTTDDDVANVFIDGNTGSPEPDWTTLVSVEFTLLMQARETAVANRLYQKTIQVLNLRLRQPD